MNFTFTWIMEKLGYMPKIDMQVGKVNLDVKPPEFKMWNFPKEEKKPKVIAKKIVAKKKPSVKTTKAKK